MPRKLRMEYSGAICHVMNRGDGWEDIFRDEQDRDKFLPTLTESYLETRSSGASSLRSPIDKRPARESREDGERWLKEVEVGGKRAFGTPKEIPEESHWRWI
ncbi:MAG: hypothetical protein O2960_06625 [Verrucomicrobia bacterium]|nr:hypothetical protein [Verrucomicrobiota bacterium]